jgi:hypothetical protein
LHCTAFLVLLADKDHAKRKYRVTASVRSQAKAQEILALHPAWKGQVDFIYVADVGAQGAFDQVFENAGDGFHYIIHTASPVNFNVVDFQKDLIDPAVRG